MRVPAPGTNRKFSVFGALDYRSGKVHWQISPAKNGEQFVSFMDKLAQSYPDSKLVVVLDNVGYHKSRLCSQWWEAHRDRVRPFWLPVYTPELNLIERVWKELKDKLSCHRWHADMEALKTTTQKLLECTQARFHDHRSPSITMDQYFCQTA